MVSNPNNTGRSMGTRSSEAPANDRRYRWDVSIGRMVHLATLNSSFEAQVVAARLGAEGVVWQLQGPIGGPLPLSEVSVLVDEGDLVRAREILLVADLGRSGDQFDLDPVADRPVVRRRRGVALAMVAGVVVLAVTRTIGMHMV